MDRDGGLADAFADSFDSVAASADPTTSAIVVISMFADQPSQSLVGGCADTRLHLGPRPDHRPTRTALPRRGASVRRCSTSAGGRSDHPYRTAVRQR